MKGEALASRVFAYANHEDEKVTLIMRRLLSSIVSSLLCFTNQRTCDSHLDDPYHELFVDIDTSMKMGRLWYDKCNPLQYNIISGLITSNQANKIFFISKLISI